MKKLGTVFIVFIAVISLLPLGDILDDNSFNYSHIKNCFESVESYDDAFVTDISKLGFYGDIISTVVTDSLKAEIVYASDFEWSSGARGFVSPNGDVVFSVLYYDEDSFVTSRASGSGGGRGISYYVDFPTPFNINSDGYSEYESYVQRTYFPIKLFINSYNDYLEADNFFENMIAGIGVVSGGIFGIVFLLIVFLFDSISMIWGVILCVLRLIGIVPLPI